MRARSWWWLGLLLCFQAAAQIYLPGRNPNDTVVPQFYRQNNNTKTTIQELTANAGTNKFGTNLIPPLHLLGVTDTNYAGMVVGIDPTTLLLKRGTVPLADVQSAAAVAATNTAQAATNALVVSAVNTLAAAQTATNTVQAATNAAVVAAVNANAAAASAAAAAAQAVADAAVAQPFRFTSSGLTLTVAATTYPDAVGAIQTFAGGTMALNPTYTNYVYLIGGVPMGFSRAEHRGGIYLGYAITSGSVVTRFWQPAKPLPFTTRIPRFLAGQALGVPQKVGGLGDSITQGAQASSSLWWFNTLFSSTYSSAGRNVLNVANITLSNWGQSGSSVEWGLAFTGEMISRPSGGVGQFPATGMHRTRYNNSLMLPSAKKAVGTPIHLKGRYDLVTVGFGNSSPWNIDLSCAHLETIIQRLQEMGSEVILHSEQPFYTSGAISNWALLRDAKRLRAIADSRCCEFADTFGRIQFLYDAGLEGTYYSGDHTHPNTAGHDEWAKVIGSICDPRMALAGEAYPPKRSQYPLGAFSTAYGSGVDVCFEYSGTGTVGADPVAASYGAPNLNALATGADSTHNAYLLEVGEKVNITHGGMTGLGVITALPSGSSASCSIVDQSGTTYATFTVTGSFGAQINKVFQLGDFAAFSSGISGNWYEGSASPTRLPAYSMDAWLIVNSITGPATELPFICPFMEGPVRKEISNSAVTLQGEWGMDANSGHETGLGVLFTDTAGSSMSIPYDTDALEVWLIVGSKTGYVDIFVDGETVCTNTRLGPVTNAGYVYHLFLQQNNSPLNHPTQTGYRTARTTPHFAQIYLRTAGTTPVDGNHSLTITHKAGINFE